MPKCFGTEGDAASLTYCTCIWVNDTWAQQVADPPVIQPKAGVVEGRGVDGQHTRECNAVCPYKGSPPVQSTKSYAPTHPNQGEE